MDALWAHWTTGALLLGLTGAMPYTGPLARAEEPAAPTLAALQWARLPGAEGCIAGDELARQVEAKLGHAAFPSPREAKVLLEGHVQQTEHGYVAALKMRARDGALLGERELQSEQADCRELSETLVLVLALMIDPESAQRSEPPPSPPLPGPPITPPVSAEEPRTSHSLSAFARLSLGLFPTTAVGFGAAYELGFRRFGGLRIEGVGYLEERSSAAGTQPRKGVELTLAHAGVAYCPLWRTLARVRLAGCLGVELGALNSQGYGFADIRSDASLWASGSARVHADVELMRGLALHVGAILLVPRSASYRGTLQSGESVTMETGQPVAGAFDLGVGASF